MNSGKGVNETNRVHILWYTPYDLKITNYDALINLLDDLNNQLYQQKPLKYDYNNLSTILKKHYDIIQKIDKNAINQFCNFYDLFSQNNFIYNLRHITNQIKPEIDECIQLLYNRKQQYLKNNFIVAAHYPNYKDFDVFHMHTYDQKFGKKTTFDKFNGNYIDNSSERVFIWNKQPLNMQNILLRFIISININEQITQEKIKTKVKEELNKFNRLSLYDDNKLKNSNKLLFNKFQS